MRKIFYIQESNSYRDEVINAMPQWKSYILEQTDDTNEKLTLAQDNFTSNNEKLNSYITYIKDAKNTADAITIEIKDITAQMEAILEEALVYYNTIIVDNELLRSKYRLRDITNLFNSNAPTREGSLLYQYILRINQGMGDDPTSINRLIRGNNYIVNTALFIPDIQSNEEHLSNVIDYWMDYHDLNSSISGGMKVNGVSDPVVPPGDLYIANEKAKRELSDKILLAKIDLISIICLDFKLRLKMKRNTSSSFKLISRQLILLRNGKAFS